MKYSLLSMIFFLCNNSVIAQVKFGVKAGINISNQTNVLQYLSVAGDPGTENGNPLTGFQTSLFADAHLKKSLVLRPEINYSAQGYKREEKKDFAGNLLLETATVKLQY